MAVSGMPEDSPGSARRSKALAHQNGQSVSDILNIVCIVCIIVNCMYCAWPLEIKIVGCLFK